MPLALYALTAGAFGIGVTEFVIMGLLLDVSADLGVSISAAGLLISGYALGVVVGAPLLGALTGRLPRKTLLLALMVVFTVGNLACALAPDYWTLMAARVLTAFAHASFFGVGSVVATSLVAPNRKASAIALMFTGLTVANILGVPFGTWLGQAYGWRSSFLAVTLVGVVAFAVIALLVPRDEPAATDEEESSEGTLAVLARRPVLLGLLTTVLSWVGVFAAFTYLAPILTRVTGFSEASVSPILLVFGGGLVAGNLLGGRLADRHLVPTVVGTLVALSAVLFVMTAAIHQPIAAIVARCGCWRRPRAPARAWRPPSTLPPSISATPSAPGLAASSSTTAPASAPSPSLPAWCRSPRSAWCFWRCASNAAARSASRSRRSAER
jgi:DHA1 family inner membrane transport protein